MGFIIVDWRRIEFIEIKVLIRHLLLYLERIWASTLTILKTVFTHVPLETQACTPTSSTTSSTSPSTSFAASVSNRIIWTFSIGNSGKFVGIISFDKTALDKVLKGWVDFGVHSTRFGNWVFELLLCFRDESKLEKRLFEIADVPFGQMAASWIANKKHDVL